MSRLLLALTLFASAPAFAVGSDSLSLDSLFQSAKTLSVTDIPLPFSCYVDGVVVLEVHTTAVGEIPLVEVRREFPCLTPLAVKAVEEWRFSPATYDGEAVASRVPVVVTFRPPSAITEPVSLSQPQPPTEAALQEAFQPAEVLHAVYPDYPVNTVVWGTVVLEVTLGKKGETIGVRVLRDITPLTAEAQAVLGKWRFHPATFNGAPVDSKIVMAFVFSPIYSAPRHGR